VEGARGSHRLCQRDAEIPVREDDSARLKTDQAKHSTALQFIRNFLFYIRGDRLSSFFLKAKGAGEAGGSIFSGNDKRNNQ